MNIKTKLTYGTAVLLIGVIAIAAISLFALKSIESSVFRLTDESVPLNNKIVALSKAIQDLSNDLSDLGSATDINQLNQTISKIETDFRTVKTLETDIAKLDKNGLAVNQHTFKQAYQDIHTAVLKRINILATYEREEVKLHNAVEEIEKSLFMVNSDINRLNASSKVKRGENIIDDDIHELATTINLVIQANTAKEIEQDTAAFERINKKVHDGLTASIKALKGSGDLSNINQVQDQLNAVTIAANNLIKTKRHRK